MAEAEDREDVEEIEQAAELVERVAAIDIAKASGMVCVRVPHEDKPGKRVQRVFNTVATSGAILELADHLICQGVTRVVMEATSTYWKPYFFLLESRGLECWLVNARDVKNVPGRPKTDRLDAVWLAKLTERGMLRPSFVPPKPIRELRDLTRARAVMTHERTRHKQRTEKLLEDAQIKLSTVIADIFGVSGRAMLEALIAGERSPKALADLAHGTIKASHATLAESLTGRFEEHHAFMCRMLLDTVDYLTVQIDKLTARITLRLAGLSTTEDDEGPGQGTLIPITDTERLDEIPGIGPGTAQVILAETGLDMSVFPTAGHLVSWAKLSPRTIQSGGKNTSGPTGKGNPWLRGALGEAAISAARTDTFLGARYRRIAKRRGHMKALVAVARSILVSVWHLMSDPTARYRDLGAHFHTRNLDPTRKTRDLVRQLAALGHDVTLTPAAA
ncbi:IS110 family transposase [Streptomyces sp. NBC_00846]|uniref:IS110 family transposase n=1 Tax=Streptomyces sp. NBC_00846 TaxID=2975849 RepID=UPI00386F4043|nr:IS110 family transposase [Streptomyces sp. NBC_00846]WTA35646.1 IS110 family transposase [Streptomyces sp. NBC_00846]WTA36712.1 IS110 family transposase [Streptomyces sp. NBC_00846]WTA40157.1 IS110 family transposase [Streptomyces sp. NBC_00846]